MSFAELQSAIAAQARAVQAAGGQGDAHHALADLAGATHPLSVKAARKALAEAAESAQGDAAAPLRAASPAEIQAGVFLLEVLTAAGARPSLRRALEALLQALEQSGVSAGLLAEAHRELSGEKAIATAARRAEAAERRQARAGRIACFVEILRSTERAERPLLEALAAMHGHRPALTAVEWRAVAHEVTGRRVTTKAAAEATLRRWIAYAAAGGAPGRAGRGRAALLEPAEGEAS